MDKVEQVCKVCGGKVLSGIAPCDGSYYQAEDDSCAAAKRVPNEIKAPVLELDSPQWHDN